MAVCRKKQQDTDAEFTKKIEVTTVNVSDDEYGLYTVSGGRTEPILVDVTINGIETKMEVDTGASVSLVSEDTYELITTEKTHLRKVKDKLLTYTGETVPVLGVVDVTVKYQGKMSTLPLYVVRGIYPSLLGRNWLTVVKLDWKHILTVRSERRLQDVLDKHKSVFREGLGKLEGVQAKIHLKPGATPKFHKARTVPYATRAKLDEELDRLQSLGVIKPIQFSEWATPVVPVAKKNGRVRLCGDYRITINQAARGDKYPLPRIEDLFASLSGGKKFTKLDLKHAYLQIELDAESKPLVTINTHRGLFQYERLPFGVSAAPSIFQRVMDNLLQGIPGVCVYLDDILITGSTEDEHLKHLDEVLMKLSKAGLTLKKSKCSFLLEAVEYLGHTISKEGLHTSESKVQAILGAPAPKDVSELRSFLGLVNYYSKFLPDLASKLAPLYKLLQKTCKWKWGPKEQAALDHVKNLLRSSQVLVHFDDKLPLVLSCDASPYGLGAVLSHRMENGDERPICYASRTLSEAEKKYSHLDKEALAIIFGVKKYHHYLYGREFELKTDHKPLTHIFGETKAIPTMASGRIQRWAITLGAYSYRISHKAGKENANADALSRLPLPVSREEPPKPQEVVHLMEYLDTTPVTSKQIGDWTDHDPVLSKVKDWTLSGWPKEKLADPELEPYWRRRYELSVENRCVLWGNRVVVPSKGRKRVSDMLHEAHPGIVRMKALARSYVWWPKIDTELEAHCSKCEICQTRARSPPVVPLHPWSWPSTPWSRVHVDHAGPFMGKMFFIMCDAHSKWLEVHITPSTSSAATIQLMRKTFATMGLPEVVVSDNATTFTSEEFHQFLQKNGVRHIKTPPYHPASNGLAERAVQTFKEGMKKQREGSLETKLSRFLFSYRLTPHSSTGVSPAELMFGRRLRSPLDCLKPHLAEKVKSSQEHQKGCHDRHAKPREFEVDALVYARNYGAGLPWLPGKVVEKLGTVMYRILLEDGRKVRKHADQLKHRVMEPSAEPDSDFELDLPFGNAATVQADVEATEPEEPPDPEEGTSPQRPSIPPVRRQSSRVRRPPDRYGC